MWRALLWDSTHVSQGHLSAVLLWPPGDLTPTPSGDQPPKGSPRVLPPLSGFLAQALEVTQREGRSRVQEKCHHRHLCAVLPRAMRGPGASASIYFEPWDLESKLIWEKGAFVFEEFTGQGEVVAFYSNKLKKIKWSSQGGG